MSFWVNVIHISLPSSTVMVHSLNAALKSSPYFTWTRLLAMRHSTLTSLVMSLVTVISVFPE